MSILVFDGTCTNLAGCVRRALSAEKLTTLRHKNRRAFNFQHLRGFFDFKRRIINVKGR